MQSIMQKAGGSHAAPNIAILHDMGMSGRRVMYFSKYDYACCEGHVLEVSLL